MAVKTESLACSGSGKQNYANYCNVYEMDFAFQRVQFALSVKFDKSRHTN